MRSDNPPGMLVKFDEIADRDAAERLRDVYLEAEVDPDALPEGAHYWHEVIGSRVVTDTGRELGEVADVFRVGEGEVYVVRDGDGAEVLVPAVGSVVRELAPAEKRMVINAAALGLDEGASE
jgi:16S rRNA processing protein RimM